MTEPTSIEDEIRALLRGEGQSVLSTLSLRKPGWPFGSIAPYALSARGAPLLLLSSIAEHTRNLKADPRASLLVQDPGSRADPQAGARATVLGEIRTVGAAERAEARARYLARHPEAKGYFAAHDFELFELTLEEVRYIGGFGRIHWVAGDRVALDPERDPLRPHAQGICDHMNADHAQALALVCGLGAGQSARMLGIDRFGFTAEAGEAGLIRMSFDAPLTTPAQVREKLVALAREARKKA
ncbi:MAG: HugZ family pyridoxamine 5'-phosphate oxidase [Deltaproteobacteria bacterium]